MNKQSLRNKKGKIITRNALNKHKKKKNIRREELEIVTQNIRGGAEHKMSNIVEYLDKTNIDIFVVTEAKILADVAEERDKIRSRFKNYRVFINGFTRAEVKERYMDKRKQQIERNCKDARKRTQEMLDINPNAAHASGGVMMFIHERIARYLQGEPVLSENKRVIQATLKFPKKKLEVIGIYAPASPGPEQDEFFEYLKLLSIQPNERIIIGDFNECEKRERDTWSRERASPRRDYAAFKDLLAEGDLSDAYITQNPFRSKEEGWTYFKEEHNTCTYAARIDAALVSNGLVPALVKCEPLEFNKITNKPDHKPLMLSLSATQLGITKVESVRAPEETIYRIDVSKCTPEQNEKYAKTIE